MAAQLGHRTYNLDCQEHSGRTLVLVVWFLDTNSDTEYHTRTLAVLTRCFFWKFQLLEDWPLGIRSSSAKSKELEYTANSPVSSGPKMNFDFIFIPLVRLDLTLNLTNTISLDTPLGGLLGRTIRLHYWDALLGLTIRCFQVLRLCCQVSRLSLSWTPMLSDSKR